MLDRERGGDVSFHIRIPTYLLASTGKVEYELIAMIVASARDVLSSARGSAGASGASDRDRK